SSDLLHHRRARTPDQGRRQPRPAHRHGADDPARPGRHPRGGRRSGLPAVPARVGLHQRPSRRLRRRLLLNGPNIPHVMPTEDKTAMTRTRTHPARGRRPRDRKAQIVTAAADLFHQHGYHTVTMDQIAGAVGITAGALYRHFRNKQELLARTVDDGLSAFETAVRDTAPGDIDTLLDVMASLTLDRRDLGVLWQRESRNLPDADRDRLRHRF